MCNFKSAIVVRDEGVKWFAGLAMCGLMRGVGICNDDDPERVTDEVYANKAFRLADALLAARSKQGEGM